MISVKIKKFAMSILGLLIAQRKLCAEENGNYDPIEVTLTRGELKIALGKNQMSQNLRNIWISELAEILRHHDLEVEEHVSKVRPDVSLVVTLPRARTRRTKFKSLKSLALLHPELSPQRRLV